MIRRTFEYPSNPIPLVLAIAVFAMSTAIAAPPPGYPGPFCSKQKHVGDVIIRLTERKTVTIDKVQWPMGVFQVENHGNAPLFLDGFREEGHFDIWYPAIIQEFRSDDGGWHELMYTPGSFVGPTDKIEILPGGTDTFMTDLETDNPPEGIFAPDTGESRIAYNDYKEKRCIYSEVFTMDPPKK